MSTAAAWRCKKKTGEYVNIWKKAFVALQCVNKKEGSNQRHRQSPCSINSFVSVTCKFPYMCLHPRVICSQQRRHYSQLHVYFRGNSCLNVDMRKVWGKSVKQMAGGNVWGKLVHIFLLRFSYVFCWNKYVLKIHSASFILTKECLNRIKARSVFKPILLHYSALFSIQPSIHVLIFLNILKTELLWKSGRGNLTLYCSTTLAPCTFLVWQDGALDSDAIRIDDLRKYTASVLQLLCLLFYLGK